MNFTLSRVSEAEFSLAPGCGVHLTAPSQSAGCERQPLEQGCTQPPYTTAVHKAVLKLENKNKHYVQM